VIGDFCGGATEAIYFSFRKLQGCGNRGFTHFKPLSIQGFSIKSPVILYVRVYLSEQPFR
jgi:hypothetical protein